MLYRLIKLNPVGSIQFRNLPGTGFPVPDLFTFELLILQDLTQLQFYRLKYVAR